MTSELPMYCRACGRLLVERQVLDGIVDPYTGKQRLDTERLCPRLNHWYGGVWGVFHSSFTWEEMESGRGWWQEGQWY